MLTELDLAPCRGFESSVALATVFLGRGRIVCSCESKSWERVLGPLMVNSSPSNSSKLQQSLLESVVDAKALSFSLERRPPKLSWGLRRGSCSALRELVVAKSSSQLSSSARGNGQPPSASSGT